MHTYSGRLGASAWPTTPSDATFLSEFLASARYAAVPLNEHAAKYLDVATFQGNTFALGAGEFAHRAFDGRIHPARIVRCRTPFTYFASFLRADEEAAWLSALVAGKQTEARKFYPATKAGRLVAVPSRICRECVIQDQFDFGVGHWHVLHQMPALSRCPVHREILHDLCGGCGAPLGSARSHRLPGDHCHRCNSIRTTSSLSLHCSAGYEAFEALMVKAAAGQASEMRPAVRMRVMDRIIFRRIGMRGMHAALQLFLATWNVDSADELGRLLGCVVTERLLVGLFNGIEAGSSRYLQTAVLAFALQHATAEDLTTCIDGEQGSNAFEDLFSDREASSSDSNFVRDLCRLAADVGYPVKGARALATGQPTRKLAAPNATKRFLRSLEVTSPSSHSDVLANRKVRTKRASWTRESARARISAALEEGRLTRTQLNALERSLYRWSVKHDSTWLDQVLPRTFARREGSWKGAGKEATREALLAAINDGACTRTLLIRKRFRAYLFALRHDAEWLNDVIASQRSKQPTLASCDFVASS